jgi:hypothetical protein
MKKFERKTNYIDGSVQGALVKRILLHWLGFFVVTGASFITLHAFLGDPELPFMERVSKTVSDFALLGILLLAILPAFALDTIRFSNRFVGPMMRLRRAMGEFNREGKVATLKFRGDDFWLEVANEFNIMVERVEKSKSAVQDAEREVSV